MKKTRICQLFAIEYPIIQGGMGWVSTAELAAAVSEAGGLGMVASYTAGGEENMEENLRQQIRRARSLTSKPFGVNVSLTFPQPQALMDVALEEGIRIFTTAGGNPALYTRYLKENGAKVMHPVFSTRQAKRAEEAGVDAVIASGVDAGGMLSADELSTMVLVPQVVSSVQVPVVAAGGIADVRGFVAALALGAEGVQMGTRFIATQECIVHPNFKEAIIKARDTDTVVTSRKSKMLARIIKNDLAAKIAELEDSGKTVEEVLGFIGIGRLRMAAVEGNIQEGSLMCSSAVGLINETLSVKEVIQSIVDGYDEVVNRLK